MSTLEELKNALKDTLAARGSLGQIQARVRAEIFNALEETVPHLACSVTGVAFETLWRNPLRTVDALAAAAVCDLQEEPKPQLSQENLIINELIRDYLGERHPAHNGAQGGSFASDAHRHLYHSA